MKEKNNNYKWVNKLFGTLDLHRSTCPCLITDSKGTILFCGKGVADLLGFHREDIEGKPFESFIFKKIIRQKDEVFQQVITNTLLTKTPNLVVLVDKFQHKKWLNYNLIKQVSEEHQGDIFIFFFHDTSLEYKLELFANEYSPLIVTNKSIKEPELSQQMVNITNMILEGTLSFCFFINANEDTFDTYYWSTNNKNTIFLSIPSDFSFTSAGIWTESYLTKKPTLYHSVNAEDAPNFVMSKTGKVEVTNLLSTPIFYNNQVVGVVGTINKQGGFSLVDQKMLDYISLSFTMLLSHIKNKQHEISLKEKLKFTEMKLLKTSNELLLANEKLKETSKKLAKARELAEDNKISKDGIIRSLTQELRTPMNAIVGFADLLKEEDIEEKQKNEFLTIINHSSKQMMQVVNNLVDLSKIESNDFEIIPRVFSLNNLFRELHMIFYPIIWSKKNNQVKFAYTLGFEDGKDFIIADEKRIKQVLSNLLSNAVNTTTSGFIKMTYKKYNDDFLLFTVSDSAPAYGHEDMKHMFDPKLSDKNNLFPALPDFNVALSLSKRIINLMKGEIWVDSIPEVGNTFSFTLPYKAKKLAPVENGTHTSEIKKLLSGKKILVAEDDTASFKLLLKILSSFGAEVIHAVNGKEAIELVKASNDFDLILMDINMPVVNGIEATKEIKKFNSAIPIVAQTAYTMYEEETQARKAGCNDFITKPIIKDKLLLSVTEHIRK